MSPIPPEPPSPDATGAAPASVASTSAAPTSATSTSAPDAIPDVAPEAAVAAPRPPAGHPFVLRGRVFRALALVPEAPLPDWLAELDAALARSPTLFDGRAVVLDLAALTPEPAALVALVADLVADLAARRIRVLGLEGVPEDAARNVVGASLPPRLVGGRPAPLPDLPASPAAPPAAAPPDDAAISLTTTSLTVEGSLRSGQCVVHPTGDVTVTGSVSSGAEILAGGNIHVYGALRGRAIAGAARNPRARIYCRKFEPELLGIDRLVRTAEEMGTALRGKPAQVWLDGGAIRLAGLD